MITKEQLQKQFSTNPTITNRLAVLKLACQLNPDFHTPYIVGGFLRNIILSAPPRDCDVVFRGVCRDQQGILEAVEQAEALLSLPHFSDWEFENTRATGYSGDFYADNIGQYSYHTDFLTKLLLSSDGELLLGQPEAKILSDLSTRTYDIDFSGVNIWATHRGQGRSYDSCLTGDLIRGLYLCQVLNLTPSDTVQQLFCNFDCRFSSLDPKDQQERVQFWLKKTAGAPQYQAILTQYNIKSLPITKS